MNKPTPKRREAQRGGTTRGRNEKSFEMVGQIRWARAHRDCAMMSTRRTGRIAHRSACCVRHTAYSLIVCASPDPRVTILRRKLEGTADIERSLLKSRRERSDANHETGTHGLTRPAERDLGSIIGRIVFHGMIRCEGCFLNRTATQQARTCVWLCQTRHSLDERHMMARDLNMDAQRS